MGNSGLFYTEGSTVSCPEGPIGLRGIETSILVLLSASLKIVQKMQLNRPNHCIKEFIRDHLQI